MLKRERERVKPSSSESISDRRNKESLSRRNISAQNSFSRHEVNSDKPSHPTLEVCD